jgi:hypothetical protein
MKKPAGRAFLAALYIVGIVYLLTAVTKSLPAETVLIPMAVLALFVLSAAVMGYLFLYEPLELYLENKRREALKSFGATVAVFAVFTAAFLLLLFLF